jgi:hypothetical protein
VVKLFTDDLEHAIMLAAARWNAKIDVHFAHSLLLPCSSSLYTCSMEDAAVSSTHPTVWGDAHGQGGMPPRAYSRVVANVLLSSQSGKGLPYLPPLSGLLEIDETGCSQAWSGTHFVSFQPTLYPSNLFMSLASPQMSPFSFAGKKLLTRRFHTGCSTYHKSCAHTLSFLVCVWGGGLGGGGCECVRDWGDLNVCVIGEI